MEQPSANNDASRATAPPLPPGWLGRWPWVTFVVPLAVFMLLTMLEPTPPNPTGAEGAGASAASEPFAKVDGLDEEPLPGVTAAEPSPGWFPWLPKIPYRYYPLVYSVKIALTLIAMIAVWPGYRTFPFHVNGLALVVGAVGAVLWIVLAKLRLEPQLLEPLGLGWLVDAGQRSAFNPREELADNPAWAYGFLAIRFVGLALVIPVIEEFFLRGFLMRFVVHDQWHLVPFGTVNRMALVVGTAFPVLSHPEHLAAAVWFSLISWLMVRTRNIWDCVAAHSVTNALLGAWVLYSDDWWLM